MKDGIPVSTESTITLEGRVAEAYLFAKEAHKDQKRKYTLVPYITHPLEVMEIVRSVPHTEDMLCAALLHDVVEDCGVDIGDIRKLFGEDVCRMVNKLSDISQPTHGNRAKRKELDRWWISNATPSTKTIKLADLISNSKSICEHDKDFAKVYIKEKELLLEVLTEGDPALYAQAKDIVEKAKLELEIE